MAATPNSNPVKAEVFRSSETGSGENVREFLRQETSATWQGTLVTDGFSGYAAYVDKACSARCMAHSSRKLHERWANHGSQVGEQALCASTKICSAWSARSSNLPATSGVCVRRARFEPPRTMDRLCTSFHAVDYPDHQESKQS
ncbi:IS66 family transposase [Burkholderia cepacia]|uniref:IS66 family transposase n=1 Tax=Burkholderia cepacia TaxID=292 RepID=UPI0012D9725E